MAYRLNGISAIQNHDCRNMEIYKIITLSFF